MFLSGFSLILCCVQYDSFARNHSIMQLEIILYMSLYTMKIEFKVIQAEFLIRTKIEHSNFR